MKPRVSIQLFEVNHENTKAVYRSSRLEVVLVKSALKIYSKVSGKHPCRSEISIWLLFNFVEIALLHGCSPANLLQFFRTPFSKNTSWWLLLNEWNTFKVSKCLDCRLERRNYRLSGPFLQSTNPWMFDKFLL